MTDNASNPPAIAPIDFVLEAYRQTFGVKTDFANEIHKAACIEVAQLREGNERSIRLSMLREILGALPPSIGSSKDIPDEIILSGGIETIREIVSGLSANFTSALKENAKLRENNASLTDACNLILSTASKQADEWDRFWAAMGVLSEDITVDEAIEKWQALRSDVLAGFAGGPSEPWDKKEIKAEGRRRLAAKRKNKK